MPTIYTIGHSNRSIAAFIAMLRLFEIKLLADVRSLPGSKWNIQFNRTVLERSLQEVGIQYVHMPELGGKNKTGPGTGYTAYMATNLFSNGMKELARRAAAETVAYMCAEADWRQCHRRYISDFLKREEWQVLHITGEGICTPHIISAPPLPKQGDLFYV